MAAVIDPSCSGSGMVQNHFTIQNETNLSFKEYSEQRYQKLTDQEKQKVLSLRENQAKFIQYTIDTYTNIKAIVYSTCSIFKKENEEVV